MNRNRISVNSILLIYILIAVLYHLFGYTGHFGFDDIHYAELASGLLNGDLDFGDHYAYRFPVLLLTALSYLIFGISDFASSLPALAVTISILIIVFNILREHGLQVILTGLSLTTFSNWFLFYSDKLMPDMYVALSVIWALAVIHRYKYTSNRSHTALHAILFALALLFGFMSKGSIVLMLPLLLFLLVKDMIQKRDLKFWGYSLVSGLSLLAIYLFTIWLFTGNVMGRFDAIASNSYLNQCSYDQQSLRILLKRIFAGFFGLSIYQSLATGFIFVFAVLFQKQGLRFFRLNDSFSFFLVSAIILFLSSSFMSISFSSYSPMCLDPRHYLFLIPVASIPAARIIAGFLESRRYGLQVIIALLIITVISFFLQGKTFWLLYLPLLGLFAIYLLPGKSIRFQYLFISLFSAILLLIPLDMVRYAQKVKYRVQREIAKEHVLENNSDCIIVTDEIQKRLLNYYSGFDEIQALRFLSFDEFEADPAIAEDKLLLLNWHTRYLSGLEPDDLPYYAREIPPSNELIFENKELDLSIYKLNELNLPGLSGALLLSTLNDFEKEIPFWSWPAEDVSSKIKYAGARSNQVARYSSTFEYPMDSLQAGGRQDLMIQCTIFCYSEDKTDAKIVVSIENSGTTYFWKALDVNRYLKAYSSWWPLTFVVSMNQKDLKPGSRLKVYVWKNDGSNVFIDNFGISIKGIPSSE
jgi:hypothetical protein